MGLTVFYSWQTDSAPRVNRNFIEDALNKAIRQVGRKVNLVEAPRLDKDTRGIPGSPEIFPTILEKIKKCTIFVPDLTIVGTTGDDRSTPNPNVLIEYGYALAVLDYKQIVPVLNRATGGPEDLPFDLQTRRISVQYELSEETADGERKETKQQLVRSFASEIKAVFESEVVFAGLSPASAKIAEYFVRHSEDGHSRRPEMEEAEFREELGLSAEETEQAIDELEARGLVERKPSINRRIVRPMPALFVELDSYFMGWNPVEDAVVVARELAATLGKQLVLERFDEENGWGARRLNPAVGHLILNSLVDHSNESRHPYSIFSILETAATRQWLQQGPKRLPTRSGGTKVV